MYRTAVILNLIADWYAIKFTESLCTERATTNRSNVKPSAPVPTRHGAKRLLGLGPPHIWQETADSMPGTCEFDVRHESDADSWCSGSSSSGGESEDMFDLMEQGAGGAALNMLEIEHHKLHRKCSVQRVREPNGEVVYHMFTNSGEHLLSARATGLKVNGHETLCFSQFTQKSQHCLAELRPSTKRDGEFAICYHDGGCTSSTEKTPDSPLAKSTETPNRTLGVIQHDSVSNTPLYSMKVTLPDVSGTWDPRTGYPKHMAEESGGSAIVSSYTVRTKLPAWNEEMQSYTLDYGGRARLASAKNFQLELAVPNSSSMAGKSSPTAPKSNKRRSKSRRGLEGVVLQFGKYDDNTFNLDYSYPLCGLQAFAIALVQGEGAVATPELMLSAKDMAECSVSLTKEMGMPSRDCC
eukprot:SAG11_NODE_3481_length_2421_cov_1.594315_1_plen_409_part_01